MIVLVAPLVMRVKDSKVPGKERHGEGRVGGRAGERRHFSALERDGVGVGNARRVGREENARAIRRERWAADRSRREELLDRVLPGDMFAGCGLVPAGLQVIVMEGRVEHEHEAAVGFVPPHRVIAEEDDVALSERHVDHRGRPRELGGAGEHAADPEVFFVRPAKDDARPHPLGKDGAGQVLANLGLDVELTLCGGQRRLFLELSERATLRDIGVGGRAAARGPGGALAAPAPPRPKPPPASESRKTGA